MYVLCRCNYSYDTIDVYELRPGTFNYIKTIVFLVAGILVLLDALGTQENDHKKLKEKVRNFNLVVQRIEQNISILRQKLENAGYNSVIYPGNESD